MSTGNTVTLHRVLTAPPERVYRTLLDPDAMCKWLLPHGFTGRVLRRNAHHHHPQGGGGGDRAERCA